jgi:protein-disulfide isomerase
MFQQSLLRIRASLGALLGPLFRSPFFRGPLLSGGAYDGSARPWIMPLALLALASSPACAESFSASQKAEIETIIKDYLLKKPEILREAIGVLDAREAAAVTKEREKVVADKGNGLFDPAAQAVVGNPSSKVTLVEFFDYNCGYCKRALGDLVRLVKENPDLRIVLRDFPILSADSVEAAKVANAFLRQNKGGKFWEFHQKLLGTRGHAGKTEALSIAKEFGADMDRLEKDAADPAVAAGIEESEKLAKALQINGTPTFVIGDEVVVGAVGYGDLQAKVANMKKCGKTVCS